VNTLKSRLGLSLIVSNTSLAKVSRSGGSSDANFSQSDRSTEHGKKALTY
jgi:hypothetical protein